MKIIMLLARTSSPLFTLLLEDFLPSLSPSLAWHFFLLLQASGRERVVGDTAIARREDQAVAENVHLTHQQLDKAPRIC